MDPNMDPNNHVHIIQTWKSRDSKGCLLDTMREIFLILKFTLVDTFCKDQLSLALYYTSHWVERGKMEGRS